MAINYAQLKTEINTDPKTLGYAGKQDGDIAVLLNTVGASGETIFKNLTPIEDIIAGIVKTEYTALVANDKTYLNEVVLKGQKVKTGSSALRTEMGNLFPVGSTSRTNLVAISSRSASRAEVLFGEGTTITDQDIVKAKAS